MNRSWVLILLGVLFLATTAANFYPDYAQPRMLQFLIVSQMMFLISVAVYWVGRKLDLSGRHTRVFWLMVAIALVARAVMFVGADGHWYLSDDVYRYVWDGKSTVRGINPYLYNPSAPELESLRDVRVYQHINNKHLPTIYPPLAQNLFAIGYLLTPDSPRGIKLVSVFLELLTILALAVLLSRYRIPRANLFLYLFAPIVLIEFYMSAHVDILAMPFFIAALIALHDDRPVLTGVMLGLAAMVKLPGLIFAPAIFFHFGGRKRWVFAAGCAAAVILSYVPYVAGAGWAAFGSLGVYLRDWQFNASIYFLLKYGLDLSWARPAVGILFLAWLIFVIMRKVDIRRKLFDSYAGHLCLTPTFYPWYFIWLFPLLCWNVSLPFVYLSGTTLLSYHVLLGYFETGSWHPNIWFGTALYLAFYGLLIGWTIYKRKRAIKAVIGE